MVRYHFFYLRILLMILFFGFSLFTSVQTKTKPKKIITQPSFSKERRDSWPEVPPKSDDPESVVRLRLVFFVHKPIHHKPLKNIAEDESSLVDSGQIDWSKMLIGLLSPTPPGGDEDEDEINEDDGPVNFIMNPGSMFVSRSHSRVQSKVPSPLDSPTIGYKEVQTFHLAPGNCDTINDLSLATLQDDDDQVAIRIIGVKGKIEREHKTVGLEYQGHEDESVLHVAVFLRWGPTSQDVTNFDVVHVSMKDILDHRSNSYKLMGHPNRDDGDVYYVEILSYFDFMNEPTIQPSDLNDYEELSPFIAAPVKLVLSDVFQMKRVEPAKIHPLRVTDIKPLRTPLASKKTTSIKRSPETKKPKVGEHLELILALHLPEDKSNWRAWCTVNGPDDVLIISNHLGSSQESMNGETEIGVKGGALDPQIDIKVVNSENDDEGIIEAENDDEGIIEAENDDEGIIEAEHAYYAEDEPPKIFVKYRETLEYREHGKGNRKKIRTHKVKNTDVIDFQVYMDPSPHGPGGTTVEGDLIISHKFSIPVKKLFRYESRIRRLRYRRKTMYADPESLVTYLEVLTLKVEGEVRQLIVSDPWEVSSDITESGKLMNPMTENPRKLINIQIDGIPWNEPPPLPPTLKSLISTVTSKFNGVLKTVVQNTPTTEGVLKTLVPKPPAPATLEEVQQVFDFDCSTLRHPRCPEAPREESPTSENVYYL